MRSYIGKSQRKMVRLVSTTIPKDNFIIVKCFPTKDAIKKKQPTVIWVQVITKKTLRETIESIAESNMAANYAIGIIKLPKKNTNGGQKYFLLCKGNKKWIDAGSAWNRTCKVLDEILQ